MWEDKCKVVMGSECGKILMWEIDKDKGKVVEEVLWWRRVEMRIKIHETKCGPPRVHRMN